MIDEVARHIQDMELLLTELYNLLAIKEKEKEIARLQLLMADASFWDDQNQAKRSVAQLKSLKDDVDTWKSLSTRIADVKDLVGMEDKAYEAEITKEVSKLIDDVEKFRLRIFLSARFDEASAIVEINAGAGGTEACDWSQMLFRMYVRWAESKDFKVRELDEVRGDEVGFKSVVFSVEGNFAYGYLKAEKGVHRLVRISPFDSNKRRHTSFASVDVVPDIKDEITIDIRPDELRIETYRASGCGGQHVNVTDSAVRITHIPTGLVASCQNERSQHQNKQAALRVLKAKLYELREEERKSELQKISGKKRRIEWGSQIRSYVLCPYLLVKDHRTNHQEHNAAAVLDGKLDNFIISYLKTTIDDQKTSVQ